jgi:hypothetical protein
MAEVVAIVYFLATSSLLKIVPVRTKTTKNRHFRALQKSLKALQKYFKWITSKSAFSHFAKIKKNTIAMVSGAKRGEGKYPKVL